MHRTSRIQFAGSGWCLLAFLSLCQVVRSQPVNDLFADRIALTGTNFSVVGSNEGATSEAGEPNHSGFAPSNSVWWTWTAPSFDSVRVSTIGSSFSTVLAIYTGTLDSSLTNVASASLSILTNGHYASQLNFMASNGMAYQMAVDGYHSATGSIVLSILTGLPFITSQPLSRTLAPGTNVSFSVGVTSSTPRNYQWRKDGVNLVGATGDTLSLTNVQTWDVGGYSVVISNSVGAVTSSSASLFMKAYEPYYFRTIAGKAGILSDLDGADTNATFNNPDAVAIDGAGILYVAEYDGKVIRKIVPTGTNWLTTTVAGQAGIGGFVDGSNSVARFFFPNGIALDNAGNLYVTDQGNRAIRKIVPDGTNWVVSTLVKNLGSSLGGVAVDSAGNIFFAEADRHTIRAASQIGGDWIVTNVAGLANVAGSADGTNSVARFNTPDRLALGPDGSLYVTEFWNHQVRRIAPFGSNWVVTTIAGKAGIAGSTDGTNTTARFNSPEGVAVDGQGSVYVGDWGNNTVRKIAPNGVVTTLGGFAGASGSTDGTGSSARFFSPNGLAVDTHGVVYLADNGSMIRKGEPAINLKPQLAAGPSGFQFTVSLASHLNYKIQYSSNLSVWATLSNIYPTSTSYSFVDTAVTNQAIQFYRVLGQ